MAADVLMVADELPAMQYLANQLQAQERLTSTVVTQDKLPADLSPFAAVIVYLHRNLEAATERALIHYATNGGTSKLQ